MEYLNTNASAIQAVTAIVIAVATIALVLITRRYVKLSAELADTAQRQLEYSSEERESRRRQLFTLIKMLRLQLATLPTERAEGESMRKATLWDPEDVMALQNLSATIGMKPGQIAAELGKHVRRLADLVESVKRVDPAYGFRWSEFDWKGWDEAVEGATTGLRALWDSVVESRDAGYNPDRAGETHTR